MKKMSIDNPFFQVMGRLGDIMIVNALFILCSLPILTIGAGLSALYKTCFQLMDETQQGLFKTFFTNFKSCLKRSTIAWLPMLFVGLLLFFDMIFLGTTKMIGVWKLVGIVVGCLLFLWEFLSAWLYAVLAMEDLGMKAGISKAMELSIRYLPATILMVLLNNILLFCALFGMYYVSLAIPIYLFAGFGLIGYINSYFLKNGMKKV